MDDILIHNLEDEVAQCSSSADSELKEHHHHSKGKKKKSPNKLVSSDVRNENGDTQVSDGNTTDLCPETIVTMYTSDTLSTEVRSFPGRQTSAGLYFTGASELESNIKCVLTTILFLAVVAAIIAVAIFKNPGM